MDRRERTNDLNVAVATALAGLQAGIWTAMPGILQSFDAEKRTCTVQLAIQPTVLSKDGTVSNVTIEVLADCPVVFPSGGDYELTFPLVEGDEGLVVLSCRCIDAWWESGGVQPQAELRMHDLSDGFLLAGCYSQARKPAASASTTSARLSKKDGTVYLELGALGVKVVGNVDVEGNLAVTGSITWPNGSINGGGGAPELAITGALSATQEITAMKTGPGTGVKLSTHTTSGVTSGGGTSGPPVPGT